MKESIRKILLVIIRLALKPVVLILHKHFVPHFSHDFQCRPVFMVRELPGKAEDWSGTRRRHVQLGNTFSWNRYFNHHLNTRPKTLFDIERFLVRCKYVSDFVTRSQKDFWDPPDIFEKRRSGDCEDHAIWAWRQLDELGYHARLVLGTRGGKNHGHAWVHIFINDRCYLMEPASKHYWFPNPEHYKAGWSVERAEEKKFLFFEHLAET